MRADPVSGHYNYCLEEECAIWNGWDECCSIAKIADNLADIAYALRK